MIERVGTTWPSDSIASSRVAAVIRVPVTTSTPPFAMVSRHT